MTICPYCQVNPVPPWRGAGKHPVHCGDRACRLKRKRETNQPGDHARAREREAIRSGAQTCPYCKTARMGRRPNAATCGGWQCRVARKTTTDIASHQRQEEQRQQVRLGIIPPPVRAPRETDDAITRLIAEAKAARLAEERRTGQRRYTITDGWAQKPGRSSMDGEIRAMELAE
jgi:hypothetical protein